MTLAELDRLIASKRRVKKVEAQEKATYDYILGDLIGRSIARIYNSANHYPEIQTIYPTIFDDLHIEEKQQEHKMELSALRFKLFADSFNKRFSKECKNKE